MIMPYDKSHTQTFIFLSKHIHIGVTIVLGLIIFDNMASAPQPHKKPQNKTNKETKKPSNVYPHTREYPTLFQKKIHIKKCWVAVGGREEIKFSIQHIF